MLFVGDHGIRAASVRNLAGFWSVDCYASIMYIVVVALFTSVYGQFIEPKCRK